MTRCRGSTLAYQTPRNSISTSTENVFLKRLLCFHPFSSPRVNICVIKVRQSRGEPVQGEYSLRCTRRVLVACSTQEAVRPIHRTMSAESYYVNVDTHRPCESFPPMLWQSMRRERNRRCRFYPPLGLWRISSQKGVKHSAAYGYCVPLTVLHQEFITA